MTNKETVEYARKLALCDEVLNRNIRWWHRRQWSMPIADRGKPFIEWLDWMIEHLSYQIDMWYDIPKEIPPAEDLVCALRVNAIGDGLALDESKRAEDDGFEADANCYVEEGVVNSNVWIRHVDPDKTRARAEEVRARFASSGYSVEICSDAEDPRGATLMATIDFPVYASLAVCRKLSEAAQA